MMKKIVTTILTTCSITLAMLATDTPKDLLSFENLLVHYSSVEQAEYEGRESIHIRNTPAKPNAPVAFIKGTEFQNGIIEVDIASKLFAGIAFRATDSDHYDKVYFRPFNSNTEKHQKTVQYVYEGNPNYTWKALRENFPGKYESGADIPILKWFHVKLVIEGKRVEVYVNHSDTPVLIVNETLTNNENGMIGIWGWDAYFSNFSYTPMK